MKDFFKNGLVLGFVKVKLLGQQCFSHVGTEPPLTGYLPVLWGDLGVVLKHTTQRLWHSNPGPLAPEPDTLPLVHCAQNHPRLYAYPCFLHK